MKTSKWPDYLFTVAVRFIFGGIFGGLAGMLLGWRGILGSEAHSSLKAIGFWLVGWFVLGSIIAVFTVPSWQTPWYKREKLWEMNDEEEESKE